MSAGLDSIAATEFAQILSNESKLELPSTMLFDHPTLDSIASFLSTEVCGDPVTEVISEKQQLHQHLLSST